MGWIDSSFFYATFGTKEVGVRILNRCHAKCYLHSQQGSNIHNNSYLIHKNWCPLLWTQFKELLVIKHILSTKHKIGFSCLHVVISHDSNSSYIRRTLVPWYSYMLLSIEFFSFFCLRLFLYLVLRVLLWIVWFWYIECIEGVL